MDNEKVVKDEKKTQFMMKNKQALFGACAPRV